MVKRKMPDTDMSDADIEAEAQEIEYDVMRRLRIAVTPTDEVKLGVLRGAIALLTAGRVEGREPHSRADGSYREDKFSRVLWVKEAEDKIRMYETNVPIETRRWDD